MLLLFLHRAALHMRANLRVKKVLAGYLTAVEEIRISNTRQMVVNCDVDLFLVMSFVTSGAQAKCVMLTD